jgi:hypothetical protein
MANTATIQISWLGFFGLLGVSTIAMLGIDIFRFGAHTDTALSMFVVLNWALAFFWIRHCDPGLVKQFRGIHVSYQLFPIVGTVTSVSGVVCASALKALFCSLGFCI